jgi:hypothetical protein
MHPVLSACLALILALPAAAQTVDTRPGDSLIAVVDLDARLRGRELIFFDGGVSHFYNDGRYTYAYDMGSGGYAYGYFEVTEDSTVCIRFITGASRCDAMIENDGRLILITSAGDRFPVREARDAGPDPLPE